MVLIITNPSLKDFKEHIGIDSAALESRVFPSRTHNYFICSTYKFNGADGTYFAIAGNFFYLRGAKEISDDNLRNIYNQLNQNTEQLNKLSPNLELGSFEQFKESLKDKQRMMEIYYDAAVIMKKQIENYNDFQKDINLATINPTTS